MDIKDYLKEQINYGADLDDIIDDIEAAYNDLKEKKMLLDQKKTDAHFITELELDFIKKYYPDVYDKSYEDVTIEELADEFIESLELASKGFCSSKEFFDELFDSLK